MVTVEKITTNIVMAGAKPECSPVIIAAMEALTNKKYDDRHVFLSAGSFNFLIVVSGPTVMDIEMIENYPNFSEGVIGWQLGMEMMFKAKKYGVEVMHVTANSVQVSSSNKWIICSDGNTCNTSVKVFAGGLVPKKPGVSSEEGFCDRGVISCASCNGSQFVGQIVAVFSGGDSGITEALYLTKIAEKIIVIGAIPQQNTAAIIRDRATQSGVILIDEGRADTGK
jgi:thioredoxin reductase